MILLMISGIYRVFVGVLETYRVIEFTDLRKKEEFIGY